MSYYKDVFCNLYTEFETNLSTHNGENIFKDDKNIDGDTDNYEAMLSY